MKLSGLVAGGFSIGVHRLLPLLVQLLVSTGGSKSLVG
jgi:hypothetical protein